MKKTIKLKIKGIKGEKGDTPSTDELVSIIAPLIPEPIKGDTGEKGEKGDRGEDGKDGADGYTPIKNVDYFDGVKGEKGDKGDDGKDIDESVVNEIQEKVNRALNIASRDYDFTELKDISITNPTNGQVPKYNSTTGKWENGDVFSGGVQSVVAGTNILVDDTDPLNPVISSLSDRYKTTSSTSQEIVSTGTLTFTVDSDLSYIPLQDVIIAYDVNNHMHGTIVSYSGTSLVVDIQHKTGSGTYDSWIINLDGIASSGISSITSSDGSIIVGGTPTEPDIIIDMAILDGKYGQKNDSNVWVGDNEFQGTTTFTGSMAGSGAGLTDVVHPEDLEVKDGSVVRISDYISEITNGAVTTTLTRDVNNFISSFTNGTQTVEITRDGNNRITSWNVV